MIVLGFRYFVKYVVNALIIFFMYMFFIQYCYFITTMIIFVVFFVKTTFCQNCSHICSVQNRGIVTHRFTANEEPILNCPGYMSVLICYNIGTEIGVVKTPAFRIYARCVNLKRGALTYLQSEQTGL